MLRALIAFVACSALVMSLADPVSGQPRRWVAVPDRSWVGFDAEHPFGPFSGKSEAPTAQFQADIADLKKGVRGALTIKVTSLTTGDPARDRDMWKVLDAEHHPEIRYTIEKVESSFPTISENTDVLLTIHGPMSIRGVDRAIAFLGRVRLRQGKLWVRGEARFSLTDFGITPPRRWFLKVKNSVLTSFDLTLRPE